MKSFMIQIGKDDIKGRHYPRSYAIWATQHNNVNVQRMITMQRNHHSSEPCEDQHKYICQRPAAALQGFDALGKKSEKSRVERVIRMNSDIMVP